MPRQPITPSVIYKEISRLPGYRFGSDGSVWSRKKKGGQGAYDVIWRRLKTTTQSGGHLYAWLGRKRGDFVHRLILEAFIGLCPDGMQCRHLDGNPANNHISNLRWGTYKENAEDKVRHGRSNKGEKASGAKLTENAVREIVSQFNAGVTQGHIATAFGIARTNVQAIVYGKSWNHVTGLPKKHR